MSTWLGFLRAINLGATRKFPKADIVAATEAAGFADVVTHINTGNVRLTTRMRSRARIEEALERAYREKVGFEVPTVCFTPGEMRQIVADADGFAPLLPEGGTHYVSLLKDAPDAETARAVEALSSDGDQVLVRDRAVHLLVADAYQQARVSNAHVEKMLGVATNRNLNVIRTVTQRWC